MIHPTKHIPAELTLLGAGIVIYRELSQPCTVTVLWEKVRKAKGVGAFDRFVLALTMLFSLHVVDFDGGLVKRTTP